MHSHTGQPIQIHADVTTTDRQIWGQDPAVVWACPFHYQVKQPWGEERGRGEQEVKAQGNAALGILGETREEH